MIIQILKIYMYIFVMLLDIIFPRFCVGCKKLGKYLCSTCISELYSIEEDVCPCCEKKSFLGLKHPNCDGDLDGNFSLFYYRGVSKKIITSIKYQLIYSIWNEFQNYIPLNRLEKLATLKQFYINASLQAIPLHSSRHKLRGFNQARLLESYISKKLNLKSINLLNRVKKTDAQVQTSSRYKRFKNVQGAFTINKNIPLPTSIILIDDVYTTGSTCKEAARILKFSGVQNVFSITIAKD